eukprot:TRINITY_DN1218_c0_g1_i1.p1 TRINITY_DN1218_c0_g1~~TRINITY_DN1218_c0_g1_i1.p1  ORF type:complete len:180 (-),score=30.98 TRINITY_DN1218_c0_g1_i1:549-1031(-)
MPLFDTLHHTFCHNWKDLSLASWRKYPCADRPDVLNVDIIDKHYDPSTGILTATRWIITRGALPGWMAALIGQKACMFVEETTVDSRNQIMQLRSRNISFNSLFELEEVCTYTVDPQNKEWTHFKQDVEVSAFSFGLSGRIEQFSIDKFKENAVKVSRVP